MNQLTFLEKIHVLFELLFSSPIIIGIFVFSMLLMILLFFYSRINKKIIKFIFIGIYALIIGFSIIKYGSYFLTSIDSFLTLFMANIYFPIIPIYVVIMFISFIIMIITLGNKNKSKFIKIINTIFFTLIQMLFAIFIYVIESNKIDLSNNTGLYTNEQTLTLLELGMGLFVIWIIILLVILYLKKADKIFKSKNVDEHDDFDEYINDYNVPNSNVEKNNDDSLSFNNSLVQNLVPEISQEEEIIDFDDVQINGSPVIDSTNSNVKTNYEVIDDSMNLGYNNNSASDSNSSKKYVNNINSSVFDSFQFLDVPSYVPERKNDDVEVIDFD